MLKVGNLCLRRLHCLRSVWLVIQWVNAVYLVATPVERARHQLAVPGQHIVPPYQNRELIADMQSSVSVKKSV